MTTIYQLTFAKHLISLANCEKLQAHILTQIHINLLTCDELSLELRRSFMKWKNKKCSKVWCSYILWSLCDVFQSRRKLTHVWRLIVEAFIWDSNFRTSLMFFYFIFRWDFIFCLLLLCCVLLEVKKVPSDDELSDVKVAIKIFITVFCLFRKLIQISHISLWH